MPTFAQQQSRPHDNILTNPARLDRADSQLASMGNRLLAQQQALSNQAVQRRLLSRVIQAKLTISQPGDQYEQEADRVVDAVMRMPDPYTPKGAAVGAQIQGIQTQRMCSGCEEELHRQPMEEEEEKFQAKEVSAHTPQVTPDVQVQVNTMRGGQLLPKSVRAFFEPRFGRDFSQVHVHTDAQAAESARAVNAIAYTVGRNIFFGRGQYRPQTQEGKRLLAHELTHVVQQRERPRDLTRELELGQFSDAYEQGANTTAAIVASGQEALRVSALGSGVRIQRQLGEGQEFEGRREAQANAQMIRRTREITEMVLEQLDSFVPSSKVLLSSFMAVKRTRGLRQFALDLHARRHEKHGNYLIYFFRVLRTDFGEKIIKRFLEMLAEEGVVISEFIEEYPLRFQIADYIDRNIEETEQILIGEPEDSSWWVLKGALVETFYTFEEGFVDVLRIGQGSEEAARAYAFEKDTVDRWAGVVKGLSEDFLRLTVIFAPLEKAGIQGAEEVITSQLAKKADDAIKIYANDVKALGSKTVTPAEKEAAKIATNAAEDTAKKVASEMQSAKTAEKIGGKPKKKVTKKKAPKKSPAAEKRPRLRRGAAAARLPLERFRNFKESLRGAGAERQKQILQLAESDAQQAGREYQQLVAENLRAIDVQETFRRPGRRMDIGISHEVTIEGRRGSFGSHKLDQFWLDMKDRGEVILTVPQLSEAAKDQLMRLAAQAEEQFGRRIYIFVRETL